MKNCYKMMAQFVFNTEFLILGTDMYKIKNDSAQDNVSNSFLRKQISIIYGMKLILG